MQFEALTSPDNVRNNLSKCLSFVFIKNRLTDSKNGGIMLSAQIVLSDHMQLLVVVMMTTNPFRRGHSLRQSQNTNKGSLMGCSEKSTNMVTWISSVFSSGATWLEGAGKVCQEVRKLWNALSLWFSNDLLYILHKQYNGVPICGKIISGGKFSSFHIHYYTSFSQFLFMIHTKHCGKSEL